MENTKERMLDATIELICEGKKPSEITVADITEKAGVGNGMVNYHFQSKDNLMRAAVKKSMDCTPEILAEGMSFEQNAAPKEKITAALQRILDLVAENAEMSRIAMLDDLENESNVPHIVGQSELFRSCLAELSKNDTQQMRMRQIAAEGFVNTLFLKAASNKRETGFDFYNKAQRDQAAQQFIAAMFP
jgi:Transcriptional regulator